MSGYHWNRTPTAKFPEENSGQAAETNSKAITLHNAVSTLHPSAAIASASRAALTSPLNNIT
jgi:hypothetical protein